jgi:hypothetical protein
MVLTQPVPQSSSPAWQAQAPAVHAWPAAQALAQAPQLAGLVIKLMQPAPQSCVPAAQVQMALLQP